jgi:hypothetical protein
MVDPCQEGETENVSIRNERGKRKKAQTYDLLQLADPLLGVVLLPREDVVGCLEVGQLKVKLLDLFPEATLGLGVLALMVLLNGGELGARLLEFGLRR